MKLNLKIQNTNKSASWLFAMIYKIKKFLVRLRKQERIQINETEAEQKDGKQTVSKYKRL